MKLVLTIVRDDHAEQVVDSLIEQGFYVTRMASTGGFLRAGNTMLLSGVEDDQVEPMLEIIGAHSDVHAQPPASSKPQETQASRAVVFVLGLERLEKL